MKIEGHGLVLALACRHHQNLHLAAPTNIPNMGDIPPNFNTDIYQYHHIHIYNLIIFYNKDFGIVANDILSQ
jgi:hypothetical protein